MPDGEHRAVTRRSSRVSQLVRQLADISIAATDGAYLGSESDFLERLEVSRPTFRQALKIVESDRLIAVRKGQGGGIFASRPGAEDVIRAPARFLRLQGAKLNDVGEAVTPISIRAARLAAGCRDADLRQQLAELKTTLADEPINEATTDSLITSETSLGRLISVMSGNPAIQLFMEIGYTFGGVERAVRLYQAPQDRARARALQLDLCDAVLSGDADIAALMMSRRSAMIAEWLSVDWPNEDDAGAK